MSKILSLLAITLIGGTGFAFLNGADNAAKRRLAEVAITTGSIPSSSEHKSLAATDAPSPSDAVVRDQGMPHAPKIVLVTSPQRLTLIRDIQLELQRVGCHAGDVGTAWDQDAKASMQRFMQSVNATLPITQPDHILLTLLQGHKAMACGAPCPDSELAIGNGHCQVYPTVAQLIDDTPPLARAFDAMLIEKLPAATVATAQAASPYRINSPARDASNEPSSRSAASPKPRRAIVVEKDEADEAPVSPRHVATAKPPARNEVASIALEPTPVAMKQPVRLGATAKPAHSPPSQTRTIVAARTTTVAQTFNTRALNARLQQMER